jgi:hypothetical protein
MRRNLSLRLATLAVAASATLAVVGASAAPTATESSVAHWNTIAVNTLIALPPTGGGAPPAAQVNVGMVQGAVYDAVNATTPKHHRPYLLKRRFGATADKDAAVATAAYTMLKEIVSTVPASVPFPTRSAVLASLASEYEASLSPIPESPFKRIGVEAGTAAAEAMIDARRGDGRFGPSQWVPNSAPGHWQPLVNPATGLPILDPTPWVGGVKPFLMQSSSQFRTAGPNALSSTAWANDFNEVKALGSVSSAVRTSLQTHVALFWQSTPVLTWNSVARNLIAEQGVDLVDSARLLALQNLAGADAAINCWNDKYYWDFWRPWNSIKRAAEDGNPATTPDPNWAALITAPYPDHPSGHLCLDGAHTRVMQLFFGTDALAFQVPSLAFPGETRSFARFSDAIAEITEARIWAGLHYRTADIQGQHLGQNVAEYGTENYFQPVGKG